MLWETVDLDNKIINLVSFSKTLGKLGLQFNIYNGMSMSGPLYLLKESIGYSTARNIVKTLLHKGLLPEQQQATKTLLIDDERDIKADFIARNYADGITLLRTKGPFKTLYLDHDLASFTEDGLEKTGYDVMCFLEKNLHLVPKEIICVSANPVGRERIQRVIKSIYRRRKEKSY